MKKLLLSLIAALTFAACAKNEPNKAFVGLWEPVGYENIDVFVISSDSIKAIQCDTKEEHYQCHYKFLHDSVIELERCWLENKVCSDPDWHPEEFFFAESQMYFDNEGYLVINPFDYRGLLETIYPNYVQLKLRKHEEK